MLWRWSDQRSVELDAVTLRWRSGGTSVVQPVSSLLLGAAPADDCPPAILEEILTAARALRKRVTLTGVPFPTIDTVASCCVAALRRLKGEETVAVSRRELSVSKIPDDRPTQTPVTCTETEVRFGAWAIFTCNEEVGGWSQGFSTWRTNDFAARGPLTLEFTSTGVTLEGALDVVETLETILPLPPGGPGGRGSG